MGRIASLEKEQSGCAPLRMARPPKNKARGDVKDLFFLRDLPLRDSPMRGFLTIGGPSLEQNQRSLQKSLNPPLPVEFELQSSPKVPCLFRLELDRGLSMAIKVFLSHKHEDAKTAGEVAAYLKLNGLEVHLDAIDSQFAKSRYCADGGECW